MSRRAARRARRAAERGWTERPRRLPQPAARSAPDLEIQAAHPGREASESVSKPRMICHRDIPYVVDGHPRQKLDLFLPENRGTGLCALVVWIHGDTWRDGSKSDCPITWLVGEGYAVASIGYRLSDTAVFPAQLDDCSVAVSFLRQHAAEWNLDPDRIAVAGTAAGGHLAALVGLANDATNDGHDRGVAAVCVVAAPTLLTTLGPNQDRATSNASLLVGGPLPEFREAAQRASPITHVSKGAPPFLILHAGRERSTGQADPVPLAQSRQFDTALRAVGAQSSLEIIDEPRETMLRSADSVGGRLLVRFLSTSLDAPHDR